MKKIWFLVWGLCFWVFLYVIEMIEKVFINVEDRDKVFYLLFLVGI